MSWTTIEVHGCRVRQEGSLRALILLQYEMRSESDMPRPQRLEMLPGTGLNTASVCLTSKGSEKRKIFCVVSE